MEFWLSKKKRKKKKSFGQEILIRRPFDLVSDCDLRICDYVYHFNLKKKDYNTIDGEMKLKREESLKEEKRKSEN